jgi:hypothetical protein
MGRWLAATAVVALLGVGAIGIRHWLTSEPLPTSNRYRITQDWRDGFIDPSGTVVIEPKLDNATGFRNGYAVITERGKHKLIDIHGKVVLESDDFEPTWPPGEGGLIEANDGRGRCGFVMLDGTVAVPFEYANVMEFHQGRAAAIRDSSGKWGYIDTKGRVVVDFIYDFPGEFVNSRAMVRRGPMFGYIDPEGNEVIPLQYSSAATFRGGLAPVQEPNGNWRYIDTAGRTVIHGPFKQAGTFSEGLAAVMLPEQRLWGFIDGTGQLMIEPQFESVSEFSEGLCGAVAPKREGYFGLGAGQPMGFIDESGAFVITFDPESIDTSVTVGGRTWQDFSDGLAWVRLNDRQGYVDRYGTFVWSCALDDASEWAAIRIENAAASVKPADRLWAAIKQNDLESAEAILDKHPDAIPPGERGHVLGLEAIDAASPEYLELLIGHGLDVKYQWYDASTLLHKLARAGERPTVAMAQSVLAAGADPNVKNSEGETPLHCVAGCIGDPAAKVDVATLLLESGAICDERNIIGETPLHSAVRYEDFKLAAALLAHGADPDIADASGKTARAMLETELAKLPAGDPQRTAIEGALRTAPWAP